MTTEQFCYWLQGFIELQETNRPSQQQWDMIKEHLTTVFKKETRGSGFPWDVKAIPAGVPKVELYGENYPANTIIC